MAQLRGAFLDLLLEGFQGVLQTQFALAQINQPVPGFILPSSPAQCRGDQADQRDRMKRPLEKGHVAQLRTESRRRVLLRATVVGQQYDRQIRPRRLLLDQTQQWFKVSAQ